MTQAAFDPCRHWLGIDAVDLANPRLVLALEPDEADPIAVLRAAEARITLLRGIAPGPFDMARKALITRVEEAREILLSQIAANSRPGPTVGTAFRPPPPPPPPAEAEAGGETVVVKRSPHYRKRSSGSGTIFVLLAGLAAAAGWLAWKKLEEQRADKPQRPKAAVARSRIERSRIEAAADNEADEGVAEDVEPVVPVRKRPARPVRPREDPADADGPDDPPAPTSDAAVSTSAPPRPRAEARPPAPAGEQPAGGSDVDEPQTDAAGRRIDAAIRRAFGALQKEDYDAAQTALDDAAGMQAGAGGRRRIERWRALATYAAGFAGYREKALATVDAGDEYVIDGRRIGIVEVDERIFIYRDRGKNVRKPRGKIPSKILMAIVTEWFDAKPANNLYLGAHYATKSEPDIDKAREYWERAQAGGADASNLLPLLDDPVFRDAVASLPE